MAAAAAVAAHRVADNLRRLDGPPRIPGIDAARGLAVVGMFAAHLYQLPELDWSDPATWGGLADGRSSILFAMLAGVSISLVTAPSGPDRAVRARAQAPGRWLARRALALWVLGILLILTGVPVYVILPAYAILFVLAIPLLHVSARVLWACTAGIALVVPWLLPAVSALPFWDSGLGEAVFLLTGWAYPVPLWLAFLLAGMGIGRLDLRHRRTLWLLLGGGAAAAAAAESLAVLIPAPATGYLAEVWTTAPHSGGILEVWGSGGFVVAVVAACILICRTPVRALALPLRTVGAMPLTAYCAQILVWALWALLALGTTTDLVAFRALEPFWPLTLGLVAATMVWALTVGRGPLESLIDAVSRPRADSLER